jgi:hypothetical protein
MRILLLTSAITGLYLTGAASAAVTITEVGPKTPSTFDTDPVGSTAGTSVADGVGISFSTGPHSSVAQGDGAGFLAPAGDTSHYLYAYGGVSIHNPDTATVTFDSPVSGFYFDWGSIDGRPSNNNVLTLDLVGGGTGAITGADLVSLYPALKGNGTVSQWFWVSDTSGGITGFTAASYAPVHSGADPHSFEFDLTSTAVPETSTWAMMAMGFAGLGYAAFRRRKRTPIAALGLA